MDEMIQNHMDVVQRFREEQLDTVKYIAQTMVECFDQGGKVLIFGNGGSAADAQHFAGELEGKYGKVREPLPALVPYNIAALTAISNDFSYDTSFDRFVQANARPEDVVIGISTSGNSPNVINAMIKAKQKEATRVGFTGEDGGKLKKYTDILLSVPSDNTQRIQECHVLAYHLICDYIDDRVRLKNITV